jgi:hypothetical protein
MPIGLVAVTRLTTLLLPRHLLDLQPASQNASAGLTGTAMRLQSAVRSSLG